MRRIGIVVLVLVLGIIAVEPLAQYAGTDARDWDALDGPSTVDFRVMLHGIDRLTAISNQDDVDLLAAVIFSDEEANALQRRVIENGRRITSWRELWELGYVSEADALFIRLCFNLAGSRPWPWEDSLRSSSVSQPAAPGSSGTDAHDWDALNGPAIVDFRVMLHGIDRLTAISNQDDVDLLAAVIFSDEEANALQRRVIENGRRITSWRELWELGYVSEADALFIRLCFGLAGSWPWDDPAPKSSELHDATLAMLPYRPEKACAYISEIIWSFDGWDNGWVWYQVILYGTGCGASGASNVYFEVVLEADREGYYWSADHRPAVELPPGTTHSFTGHVVGPPGEWTRIFASLTADGETLDSARSTWFRPPDIPRDFEF